MKPKSRFILQTQEPVRPGTSIKVVGIGGGGSNAVDHMATDTIDGVEFYVANTDAQALSKAQTRNKIQFGTRTTQGLGSGFDPQKGRAAAIEDKEQLMEFIGDAELLFITAGMGGGTGTGAAPVIAQAIKEINPKALVIAVVTTPFTFEGARRIEFAEAGLKELSACVDSLISIPNDEILTNDVPLNEAYSAANDVLLNAVRGIADVILKVGFINVDFADVQAVMSGSGKTMLSQARASGEGRARAAAEGALTNPLLKDFRVADAKGLLVNVTASPTISSNEFKQIGEVINKVASSATSIIPGLLFDEQLGNEICVTIIASGLDVASASKNGVAEQPDEEPISLEPPAPPAAAEPQPNEDEIFSDVNGSPNGTSYDNSGNGLHLNGLFVKENSDEPEVEHIPSILRRRGQAMTEVHRYEQAEL